MDYHLSVAVFFGTIACYNFVKYGVEAKKYFLVANRYHKNIQFVSLIALGFALYHCYFFTINTWIGIFVLLFLTGLYALPVLPKAKNLRSLGGMKIFLVALIWTGTTVLLPVIAVNESFVWDVGVEGVQRFILVLILMLPFEIRDLKYDAPELNTLPQHYGIESTKRVGALAAVVFFLLTFMKDNVVPFDAVSKAILLLALGVTMTRTSKNQNKYFASFWVEAIPLFWLGILWGLQLVI